jgi:cell division protein FtsQ
VSETTNRRRGLPGGGASVADKRFKRPDRPGKYRRITPRLWRIGGAILFGGALVAVGMVASARVVDAGILAVDRVVVRGQQRLSPNAVNTLKDSVLGQSLLRVDLQQFQARLLDSPWVASVTVRRIFPSTIDVRIVERDPVAIARLGQRLYLVDGAGVIMDDYGPQYADFDLPIVDGMAAPSADGGSSIDPVRAQLVSRFLGALATRPDLKRSISQINVSREANVVVLLNDDPALLYLGDDQFVDRLRTYLEIRPTLNDRMDDVESVDLRFGQRVVVKNKKRPGEPAAGEV